MNDDVEKAMQELHEAGNKYMEAMNGIRKDREEYWNSLSKEEQLKCFCAVVERIVDGEAAGHSYRGMLYTVFGFGTESYAQAQMAGFLSLHNSMFDYENADKMLLDFANMWGVEEAEEKVKEFLKKPFTSSYF